MKQVTYSQMQEELYDQENKYVLITYKQENWDKEYSEQSRTYMVGSYNKCFKSGMLGNSMYGSCIDGTDVGVRLDWYNWKVEKIMLLETQEEIDKYNAMLGKHY